MSINTYAQKAEDSVRHTINQLFLAMKTADTVLLKSCFADSVMMQTIIQKEGIPTVIHLTLSSFTEFVGGIAPGDADERVTIPILLVNGDLASAWTPYQFYYKGKLSHCGVNSFNFLRTEAGWKIIYLIDTRKPAPCQ